MTWEESAISAIPLILAAVIGGALAIVGGFFGHVWQTRKERKSVAGAFAGEIRAILGIIRKRRYMEGIEALIAAMKADNVPRPFHLDVRQFYFTVFEANAGKLGLLPSNCASDVATFYVITKSLLEDATNPNKPTDVAIHP